MTESIRYADDGRLVEVVARALYEERRRGARSPEWWGGFDRMNGQDQHRWKHYAYNVLKRAQGW